MTDETQATVETDGNDTAAVLAAASGDKTYLPEPAETPEPETAGDDPGDDAPAATDDSQAPAPKAKQSVQERINELTAARREAERDRDFYREQALRGGKPEATPAQAAQDTPQGDGRPDPSEYATDFDYIEALTDWKAEQAAERIAARRNQNDQVKSTRQAFETREKTLFPDGEPAGLTAFKQIPELPVSVLEIVGASDIGPLIAAHLGDNPAELAKLERLSPALQARELTLIETRLSAPPKPTAKTSTDAPEPPPQARGVGGQFKVSPDTSDFAAFEKQYRIGG